jgi:thioredoxin 1
MALIINDSNFDNLVLSSELPVMVDVYTEWCGPCKAISPFIEQMATEYENKALIGKMDAEKSPENATKYGIVSVPTFLFFKGGKLADKQTGAQKTALTEKLNALL